MTHCSRLRMSYIRFVVDFVSEYYYILLSAVAHNHLVMKYWGFSTFKFYDSFLFNYYFDYKVIKLIKETSHGHFFK